MGLLEGIQGRDGREGMKKAIEGRVEMANEKGGRGEQRGKITQKGFKLDTL